MNRESGFGGMKALLAVAVFGVVAFLAVKLVPPYVNNYQFQEELDTIARFTIYSQNKTADDIRGDVMVKVKDLKLPVKEDQIQVNKTTYGVNIDVKYSVRVEVPGYTFNLAFNPVAGNKMLTAKD